MTDKLDITQPLALRRDPFTRFEGQILTQTGPYPFIAVVDGSVKFWRADGKSVIERDDEMDLIPLQTAPVKWLTCWVNHYTGGDFGRAHRIREEAIARGSSQATQAEMIERAVFDMLYEAVKLILRNPISYSHHTAHEVLAKVEAKL